jgi:predicted transcriptional regulator
MDDTPTRARSAPAEWLEAIADGEADLAAGRIVPGEQIMRELRESLARLEAPDNEPSPPDGPGLR